ncbi:hypothetical protein AX15_001143 [Amanita polypyramis BW_CC]|nr:hypothetical protein AX15_001143 [Amanita polypyramis BW_CC]
MQLSLRHFVLRQQAVHLYRRALRASRAIPDPRARRETVAFFRAEFDRNSHLSNVDVIESRIKAARREINLILPLAR